MKTMIRRLSERVLKELKARLILNKERYDATIENVSENGVKVMTCSDVDILSGEKIDVEFETPSGEVLSLHCRVIWSSKLSSDSIFQNLGLEITENSAEYEEFYKSLF